MYREQHRGYRLPEIERKTDATVPQNPMYLRSLLWSDTHRLKGLATLQDALKRDVRRPITPSKVERGSFVGLALAWRNKGDPVMGVQSPHPDRINNIYSQLLS